MVNVSICSRQRKQKENNWLYFPGNAMEQDMDQLLGRETLTNLQSRELWDGNQKDEEKPHNLVYQIKLKGCLSMS